MPTPTYATDETGDERVDDGSSPVTTAGPRGEDLHVRNFDVERRYTLRIEVRDDETVLEREYRLGPGERRSETDRLAPGTYTVVASLDGDRRRVARCTIDDRPSNAALIEVGNGTVSVTDGLYR